MSKAWKLFLVNAVFFGVFLIGFILECRVPSHLIGYSVFGMLFILIFALYIVLYGIFSFLYTKKILLPNVQLFLFVVVFFYVGMIVPFHFLEDSLPKVKEAWAFFAAVGGVSLGFSLLTKGLYHLSRYVVKKIKSYL